MALTKGIHNEYDMVKPTYLLCLVSLGFLTPKQYGLMVHDVVDDNFVK